MNDYKDRGFKNFKDDDRSKYGKTVGYSSSYEKRRHEQEKIKKLLGIIYDICHLFGYDVEGRIAFKNKETGEIWK